VILGDTLSAVLSAGNYPRMYAGAILTCATCHDVHNTLNQVSYQPAAGNFLLLGTQKNSDKQGMAQPDENRHQPRVAWHYSCLILSNYFDQILHCRGHLMEMRIETGQV